MRQENKVWCGRLFWSMLGQRSELSVIQSWTHKVDGRHLCGQAESGLWFLVPQLNLHRGST